MIKDCVKINHVMLKDLCKDAGWRCEEIVHNDKHYIRVYHKYFGNDYEVE